MARQRGGKAELQDFIFVFLLIVVLVVSAWACYKYWYLRATTQLSKLFAGTFVLLLGIVMPLLSIYIVRDPDYGDD